MSSIVRDPGMVDYELLINIIRLGATSPRSSSE